MAECVFRGETPGDAGGMLHSRPVAPSATRRESDQERRERRRRSGHTVGRLSRHIQHEGGIDRSGIEIQGGR